MIFVFPNTLLQLNSFDNITNDHFADYGITITSGDYNLTITAAQ